MITTTRYRLESDVDGELIDALKRATANAMGVDAKNARSVMLGEFSPQHINVAIAELFDILDRHGKFIKELLPEIVGLRESDKVALAESRQQFMDSIRTAIIGLQRIKYQMR